VNFGQLKSIPGVLLAIRCRGEWPGKIPGPGESIGLLAKQAKCEGEVLNKSASMTPSPICTTESQARRTDLLIEEPQLLKTNIDLWRELTDEVFELRFRQRYFGDETISRQEAIDRLVAIATGRVQIKPQENAADTGNESAIGQAAIEIAILLNQPFFWRSLGLSVLAHGLAALLLLTIRLPVLRNKTIDFETETITYYKVAELFPNVAPAPGGHSLRRPLESDPQEADSRTDEEVRVRPENLRRTVSVIEQPNVPQVATLPKLPLPNILLQTSKMDPGRAPLVMSADVLRHLANEVRQPQSLGNLAQQASAQPLAAQPALPLPQLAEPAEPASPALPVRELGGNWSGLQQRGAALPYAAPPVIEESTAGFQIETMPARGQDLLVFSATPEIPKGEVAVPKVSVQGGFTGSPKPNRQSSLPPGAAELSDAAVVIPSISIVNGGAPGFVEAPTTVVQAPLPGPPPTPAPKPSQLTRSPLLDFLPSRVPSSRPLLANRAIVPTESPLRDYESQGGLVFTAAINAPNFTSKRGSWIFRFAELSNAEPAPSSVSQAPSLTAPSAVVKVDPKYAPEVVREKLEGVVILYAVLRKEGTIDAESVRVIRKLDPRVDQSASEALLNWKFRPSQKDGVPVDIQMEVSIPFYFRKAEEP